MAPAPVTAKASSAPNAQPANAEPVTNQNNKPSTKDSWLGRAINWVSDNRSKIVKFGLAILGALALLAIPVVGSALVAAACIAASAPVALTVLVTAALAIQGSVVFGTMSYAHLKQHEVIG